jgi:hypothetical protein
VRNDLFKFFTKLKEKGKRPVGIAVGDDWNLEVIVAEMAEEEIHEDSESTDERGSVQDTS